jgi:hypothetical protein
MDFYIFQLQEWQVVTIISTAHEEYSNPPFRFHTTMVKISTKSEGFATLHIEK